MKIHYFLFFFLLLGNLFPPPLLSLEPTPPFDIRNRRIVSEEGVTRTVEIDKRDLTRVAREVGGMTTFHPALPWRKLSVSKTVTVTEYVDGVTKENTITVEEWGFKFELGPEIQLSNPSSGLNKAYGEKEAPWLFGGRIHLLVALPYKVGLGAMIGWMGDFITGTVQFPQKEAEKVPFSSWTLYGLEGFYDLYSLHEIVAEGNLGGRLSISYAKHNRDLLNLWHVDGTIGFGMRLLFAGVYTGIGETLIFPSFHQVSTATPSLVNTTRFLLGAHIPLQIVRLLLELDWMNFQTMNIFMKLSLYW